jgi:hypothetical protein
VSFEKELAAHRAAAAEIRLARIKARKDQEASGAKRQTMPIVSDECKKQMSMINRNVAAMQRMVREKPEVICAKIDAIEQVGMRNHVGSIVWWDFLGRLTKAPTHLDRYINVKHEEQDAEQLTAELYRIGYGALVAFKRARITAPKRGEYGRNRGRPPIQEISANKTK